MKDIPYSKEQLMRSNMKLMEQNKRYREALKNILEDLDLNTMTVVNRDNFNWLIERAERVQELERKIERYREALVFYADENNYREQELKGIVPPRPITFKPILHDYGSIARQALEGSK